MTQLFSPLKIREVEIRNRLVVSPMCQYSAVDGMPNDWHLVHLGARAVGGAGIVVVEATAVEARGRISPADLGIWDDRMIAPFARITRFVSEQGAVPAIQLAHAGRKGSTAVPWLGRGTVEEGKGGWEVIGPTTEAFSEHYPKPHALTVDEIQGVTRAFVEATRRAQAAGFRIVEIHAAHGYLFHEFLSPLSNTRTDAYGGSFENRTRFLRETASAVRAAWPAGLPLFVRISSTDWVSGGWDKEMSVALAVELKKLGVDLIDCSSGGNVPKADIPLTPGYQVEFASAIRKRAGILTGAVGLLTEPAQVETLLQNGDADLIFLARALLRDPHWPLRAAHILGAQIDWPRQYERAKPTEQF